MYIKRLGVVAWYSYGIRARVAILFTLVRIGYPKEFTPARLKRWLQNEVSVFCKAHEGQPGFRPFTAHNFRDTAMTKAWDQDVPIDKAAIALGCHPETMKKHYIRKDRLAIADQVLGLIQTAPEETGADQGKGGEP